MLRPSDTRFFGHPIGLSTLFFTEFWERFGYYGMRALLILFLASPASKGGMGLSLAAAGAVYGLYTASVYLASLPGGWIADRFLGQRRAVMYGGLAIAAGYLLLAAPDPRLFYLGLCTVVVGTGLLKPNISTIVGQIYGPDDVRRDAGFSIFYMGINLGALIAPLICGWVGQRVSYHLGFSLSGFGMIFGVVQFWFGWKHLGDAGMHPVKPASAEEASAQSRLLRNSLLGVLVLGALLTLLDMTGLVSLSPEILVNAAGVVLLAIVVVVFVSMLSGGDWTPVERKRLAAILVLFVSASLFWSAFEQAGSSLNLFADRSSDNRLFGFDFPSSWYQTLNPLFLVICAPLLSWFWLKLGRHEPSSPSKFAIGLLFAGAGFAVLVPAALLNANGVRVTPLFLTFTYFCHAVGELSLSPVGLSAITKLAPARVGSLMMGVWFLSISIGNYVGGRLASFYGSLPIPILFSIVVGFCFVAAIVMLVIAKPATRLMGGVK